MENCCIIFNCTIVYYTMKHEPESISHLLPAERQNNYIYLLDDFKSSYEVMKYLVNFSRTQSPLKDEEASIACILDECSLHVRYIYRLDHDRRVHIRVNSDSQVVQGVLAVFADIYQGGTEKEIRQAPPVFQNYLPQGIAPSFERKDGVKRLYYRLLTYVQGW